MSAYAMIVRVGEARIDITVTWTLGTREVEMRPGGMHTFIQALDSGEHVHARLVDSISPGNEYGNFAASIREPDRTLGAMLCVAHGESDVEDVYYTMGPDDVWRWSK